MAQLIVRNLEADLVLRLKRQAAAHHRSMEAEHREILRQALQPPQPERKFKDLLLAIPAVGEDEDFTRVPAGMRDIEL